MSDELRGVSNGTYNLVEGPEENVLYFYREDGGVLGDVGRLPMDFYQAYVAQKMIDENATEVVMSNLLFEKFDEGKLIKITVFPIGAKSPELNKELQKDATEKESENDSKDNIRAVEPKESFCMRLLKRIRKIFAGFN